MNYYRYILATLALFLFIYAYESVVHGMMLMNVYMETPNLWRPYDQMMAFIPFNVFIIALIAIWVTFIFTRLFKEGGWQNGLCFGIYIGVFSGIQAASAYFYLPISTTLAAVWFISSIIEVAIGGMLIGAIYRK